MINFFKKLKSSDNNKKVGPFFDRTTKMISALERIEKDRKVVNTTEYDSLLEEKEDVYISLKDFVQLMDSDKISMEDILKCCKHASEITKTASVVEVTSIVEDGHIVLCRDPSACEKHQDVEGQKLRIVTVRSVR
jgi:hypothetical protein